MNSILQLKKTNCKNCHKCIRECPVKSIKFSENQAHIIQDECILCGACFVACPQNAKLIRNDIYIARKLLSSGKKVVVSLAPSFVSDFQVHSLSAIEKALKKLGFSAVEETAIGAQIVKKEYEQLIAAGEMPVIISSCCHTVNLLIQKYYPQVLPYLAPVISPMLAHARLLKSEDPDSYVVFIGPCVSKKDEAERYGDVDCVLTFEELREWFEQENIVLQDTLENLPDAKRTRAFPTTGGIIASMNLDIAQFAYYAVDGIDNCMHVLDEVSNGGLAGTFIEISACKGSCIGGPSTKNYTKSPLKSLKKVQDFTGDTKNEYEITQEIALQQTLSYLPLSVQRPGEQTIEKMLIKMGKTHPEDHLNCKSCGYNTCREKAIAICEGKAEISMCLPFLLAKAQSFSDAIIGNTPNAIIVMDEKLKIQQLNPASCALFHIENPEAIHGKSISTILGDVEYIACLEAEKNQAHHKHYLPEYDKYVEEFIVFDKEYNLVISIMRDVTEAENTLREKEQMNQNTAMIADKVIERQMRVVQDIASLLGETAAETKIALSKLKETLLK